MGKAATAAPRCEFLFTTMYNHTIWGGMSTGRMRGQCRGVRCRRKCMIIRSLGSIGCGGRKRFRGEVKKKSACGLDGRFSACVALNPGGFGFSLGRSRVPQPDDRLLKCADSARFFALNYGPLLWRW